jgi:hypothetical protein
VGGRVGGGIVGTVGGGVGGLDVGVGEGTVPPCRLRLCAGAAHRSGPVASDTIVSIPNSMSQIIVFLLMALS